MKFKIRNNGFIVSNNESLKEEFKNNNNLKESLPITSVINWYKLNILINQEFQKIDPTLHIRHTTDPRNYDYGTYIRFCLSIKMVDMIEGHFEAPHDLKYITVYIDPSNNSMSKNIGQADEPEQIAKILKEYIDKYGKDKSLK